MSKPAADFGIGMANEITRLKDALGAIALMYCERRVVQGVECGDGDEYCASCFARTVLKKEVGKGA